MSVNKLKSIEENKEMSIESVKKFNIQKFVDKRLPMNFHNEVANKKFETDMLCFFIDQWILANNSSLKEFMNNLEREILVKTLSKFNCNQKQAAKYLGMNYTTLNQKVKKHNIHFSKKTVNET